MVSLVQTGANDALSIGPLKIRSHHEYEVLQRRRQEAFTAWNDSHPPRFVYNLAATVFQGFLLEARSADGEIVGFLFSTPGFWSGDPNRSNRISGE